MLDKQTLISDIFATFTKDYSGSIENPNGAIQQLSSDLAAAIEKYVKSGSVKFNSGQIVGVCPQGGGPLVSGAGNEGKVE
jgi:hypothetical protein